MARVDGMNDEIRTFVRRFKNYMSSLEADLEAVGTEPFDDVVMDLEHDVNLLKELIDKIQTVD